LSSDTKGKKALENTIASTVVNNTLLHMYI